MKNVFAPEFDIKRFRYWTLNLHYNQSYLGRTICYLNTYKEKLSELEKEECFELFDIIKIYQRSLTKLWKPDWWNYAQLGNITRHLHVHFIPRYKDKRIFEGAEFIDERWGDNYAPTPKREFNQAINEKIKVKIREAIDSLENMA